jgi:hypothetical protein
MHIVVAVAAAAPTMPNLGMAQRFNPTFNAAAAQTIRWASRSRPVMFKRYITGPQRAFTICPAANHLRQETPATKEDPNHPNIHSGNHARTRNAGMLKATLSLVACLKP